MLSLPFSIRTKTSPLTPTERREYDRYPVKSRDYMESVELLRPASGIPYSWNENWDAPASRRESPRRRFLIRRESTPSSTRGTR